MNIALGGIKYPTAEELSLFPTLARVPLILPNVTWPDGSPVSVEVRALSFRERAECLRAATKRDAKTGKSEQDNERWALEVVRRGLVNPSISAEQLGILEALNANIVDALASAILSLGDVDARKITSELERMAAVDLAPDTQSSDTEGD